MIRILLDETEATSAQEAEQTLCSFATSAGVKATFSEIAPTRKNPPFRSFSAEAEFDSKEAMLKFVYEWTGGWCTDPEELEEQVIYV